MLPLFVLCITSMLYTKGVTKLLPKWRNHFTGFMTQQYLLPGSVFQCLSHIFCWIYSDRQLSIYSDRQLSIYSDRQPSIYSDTKLSIYTDRQISIYSDRQLSIYSDRQLTI